VLTRPTWLPVRLLAAFALALIAAPSVAPAQGEPNQRAAERVNTLGLDYSYARFDGTTDPWHLLAASGIHRRPSGSLIARVNLARRFAMTGAQMEVDAYPTLNKNTYAYANAGYSSSTIFPEWRLGAELFRILPRAYEGSIGFRHLRFPDDPVTLFTGSVGRYTGPYWVSLRPFVRNRPGGTKASANLTARRYGADAENYVDVRIGYGSAHSDDVTASQLARTNSMSVGLHGSRTTTGRTIGTWSLGLEREELSPDRFRNRLEAGVGVKIRR
jgi:YaiO family outer membrane protein